MVFVFYFQFWSEEITNRSASFRRARYPPHYVMGRIGEGEKGKKTEIKRIKVIYVGKGRQFPARLTSVRRGAWPPRLRPPKSGFILTKEGFTFRRASLGNAQQNEYLLLK
jgi:hypothetical protein